jgi:Mg/Co/Ni transporter MgtE
MEDTVAENVYELANREHKAKAIADVLIDRAFQAVIELAEDYDDESWAAVAKEADVNVPSEKTRKWVLEILRRRAAVINNVEKLLQPVDPFEGID